MDRAMALSRAPAVPRAGEEPHLSAPAARLPADVREPATRRDAGVTGPMAGSAAHAGAQSGYWIIDPGVAKQSQDWIYVGPSPRRPSPLYHSWWPAGLAALLVLLAVVSAAAVVLTTPTGPLPAPGESELIRQHPLRAGLLAGLLIDVALFAVATGWHAVRRGAASRRRAGSDAPASGRAAAVDRSMTYTEAAELAEAARSAQVADETADGLPGDTGVPEDDLLLSDEEAAGRQAWEGEIPVDPPVTWPDRPVVVAIGDGVSSALRSAEISRLATRTAWHRTFYHLHALGSGAPPATATPWLSIPPSWPEPGPERDRLLVRALSRAFADANSAVIMAGKGHRRQDPSERRPTATTLTLLALDQMRYFLVHIGDCSAYHVHGRTGAVEPRQVEHNRAAAYAQLDGAHYAQRYAEARRRGLQNVLTRWLGMSHDWTALDPQVLSPPGVLSPGDALVLCSDGLDKHVEPESIARAVMALDAEPATRRLVRWANDGGGSDHIAVAVLHTRHPRDRIPLAARLSLQRHAIAVALRRYLGNAISLGIGGVAVLLLVWVAVVLAVGAAQKEQPGSVPTPTALPLATPLPPATPLPGAAAGSNALPGPPAADQATATAAEANINLAGSSQGEPEPRPPGGS